MSRDKRGATRTGHKPVRAYRKEVSVQTLLSQRTHPALAQVSEQAQRQKEWRSWLLAKLPPDTVAHLSGVVEKGETLVVFTESAAWAARMRYALGEIERALKKEKPQLRKIDVRVMPKR